MSLTAIGSMALQKEKVAGKEDKMPADEVMDKFDKGKLHSGSQDGPKVKNRKQAIAIMMSEREKANQGKEEYQPSGMAERMKQAAAKRRGAK